MLVDDTVLVPERTTEDLTGEAGESSGATPAVGGEGGGATPAAGGEGGGITPVVGGAASGAAASGDQVGRRSRVESEPSGGAAAPVGDDA